MMHRERITEDIFVFTSQLYAQVTASVVITTEGAVLIDTLLYPEETLEIKQFVEHRLKVPVRYVVNTHHHADHITGTCFFPEAQVIGHRLCRQILNTRGRESLQRSKDSSGEFARVRLVLPQIVFDDSLTIQIGNKAFHFEHSPGHSFDSIVCHVQEDNVLFAADTVMPIPYFVDGRYDDFLRSLYRLKGRNFENIVQGHGDIILRGEAESYLDEAIDYLEKLKIAVDKVLESSSGDHTWQQRALASIKPEACGKSHILLNGTVGQLHHHNVLALAEQLSQQSIAMLPAE